MQENIHLPVLLNEVLESFQPLHSIKGSTFVDCTLGGAGHSLALLQTYPEIHLLACDQDDNAIKAARNTLNSFKNRVDFYHGNFSDLVQTKPADCKWNGILLDLGYSSNQLESENYGLSFLKEGPLDMRLQQPPQGLTAWDVLTQATEQELCDIFKAYGEMHNAYRVAKKIKEGLLQERITNSTRSLALFLEKLLGHSKNQIHPATLVFQALRITVNNELHRLDQFLQNVILYLSRHGRIAIISFHSLEDRIVKRWGQANTESLKVITKKPICASDEEILRNPRSRSAKLRVYEKMEDT